jgi:hypothetical protein
MATARMAMKVFSLMRKRPRATVLRRRRRSRILRPEGKISLLVSFFGRRAETLFKWGY